MKTAAVSDLNSDPESERMYFTSVLRAAAIFRSIVFILGATLFTFLCTVRITSSQPVSRSMRVIK